MAFTVKIPSDFRVEVHTNPGERYKDVYSLIYKPDGRAVLEVVDKQDLYAYIQVHKDSVDINKLMDRFQETGDMTIFLQRNQQPQYGDFVDMPKTIAEVYQRVHDIDQAFMNLSPEIREKFNNSPSEWIASYGSEKWLADMGLEGPKSAAEATNVDSVDKDVEEVK